MNNRGNVMNNLNTGYKDKFKRFIYSNDILQDSNGTKCGIIWYNYDWYVFDLDTGDMPFTLNELLSGSKVEIINGGNN